MYKVAIPPFLLLIFLISIQQLFYIPVNATPVSLETEGPVCPWEKES